MEKNPNEQSKVVNLVRWIKEVGFAVKNIMELSEVQGVKVRQNKDHLSLDLENIKKETKTLTSDVKQFRYENMGDTYGVAGGSSSSGKSNTSKVAEEKVVIGFKEEVETLIGKLQDSGEGGRLEIISIVGAAGSGKTTLAREVYNHPLLSHTFGYRAWVNVSQNYDKTMKRKLLTHILQFVSPNKKVDYEKISEDTLGEDTHKCLKDKKYLIVMDDIWDTKALDDIQRSLPKECNGNKVLFTCRQFFKHKSIHCVPHYLDPLRKSYSWELLQNKVFKNKCCPPELVGVGEQIAKKCEGLPLAIVTIAGILATKDKTPDVWEEVSKQLSSIITKKQEDCMEILELSYNHLPPHLKACFVYIGGFPKNSEILIRELIWLWIAEGFIQQSECRKSLEDIAKDYLSSLINRSLVTVSRKSSSGGIKACRIHDLWRELCLQKAEEDNFLVQIYGNDTFSAFLATKRRRLFIGSEFFCEFFPKPFSQNLRSFLCLNSQNSHDHFWERTLNMSSFVKYFELLRVLDIISAECQGKIGKGHLVYLRYLALHLPNFKSDIELPFSYLLNLETLKLQARDWKTILLPHNIFKMVKLRHLYAKRGVFKYHFSCLYPDIATGVGFDLSSKLDSLQTLHAICPCEDCRNFLVRTPNLRKLGFYGELISDGSVLMLPNLEFLECLEKLSIENSCLPDTATTLPPVLKFPQNITQLTLKYTSLKWKELSILQTMPSLEVLKLLNKACSGRIWNTSELEAFSQLKYLRLQGLKIVEWNASSDQFPKLEVLKVNDCFHLRQIPSDFANLNELREIEVKRCGFSTEDSAMKIQKERRNSRGDDGCIDFWAAHNDMEESIFDNGNLQFNCFLIFILFFLVLYLCFHFIFTYPSYIFNFCIFLLRSIKYTLEFNE